MTLVKLIQDVTSEIVCAQSFRYEPRNWAAYPDMGEYLLATGYTQTQVEHGFSLSRESLRKALGAAIRTSATVGNHESLAAAVTLVPIWGYPRGVVGPGNRLPISAVHSNRDDIAKRIAEFTTVRVSTAQMVETMTYANIGLSTLSKLLYFAGLDSHEGSMLIYDQMVMRSLHYHRFAEYGDWPAYSAIAQRATYADFVLKTRLAAEHLKCGQDVIEYALFKEGQRLGRQHAEAANEEDGLRAQQVVMGAVEELTTFTGVRFAAHFEPIGIVKLCYGKNGRTTVPAETLNALARHFSGAAVPLTATVGPSLHKWLTSNFSKVRLASYVGPVLVRLGYGVRDGSMIRFNSPMPSHVGLKFPGLYP